MKLGVRIDDGDVVEVLRGLQRALERSRRPVMRDIGEQAARAVDENLESEGHGSWPELAPSTQRERKRKGYGARGPKLKRTGQLRRSVRVLQVDDDRAVVGTDSAVGAFLDPSFPFVGVSDRDADEFAEKIFQSLDG